MRFKFGNRQQVKSDKRSTMDLGARESMENKHDGSSEEKFYRE